MEAHKLITEENIQVVLLKDKGPNARLKSFEIKDFTSKGDGYTCFVTSIEVHYSDGDQDSTTSYVVKLNPCRSEEMNVVLNLLFNREINFYEVILPKLNEQLRAINQVPLRFPEIFLSSSEFGKEFIILEDMRQRNFKMADDKLGLDVSHTKLVLREAARLHSASLLLQEHEHIESLKDKYNYLECIYSKNKYPALHEAYGPVFVSCVENSATIIGHFDKYQKLAKVLKDSAPKAFDIMASVGDGSAKHFQTIIHGDCWGNNLLFRYNSSGEPVEVCMLDHQCENVTSVGVELNHFFYTSLFPAVRRPNIKPFLACYYDTFKNVLQGAGMEMKFTEDELNEEFRRTFMVGLISTAMAAPLILVDSNDTIDMQDMDKDNSEHKMKEFNDQVIAAAKKSPLLKSKLLDTCDEFLDLGLLQ